MTDPPRRPTAGTAEITSGGLPPGAAGDGPAGATGDGPGKPGTAATGDGPEESGAAPRGDNPAGAGGPDPFLAAWSRARRGRRPRARISGRSWAVLGALATVALLVVVIGGVGPAEGLGGPWSLTAAEPESTRAIQAPPAGQPRAATGKAAPTPEPMVTTEAPAPPPAEPPADPPAADPPPRAAAVRVTAAPRAAGEPRQERAVPAEPADPPQPAAAAPAPAPAPQSTPVPQPAAAPAPAPAPQPKPKPQSDISTFADLATGFCLDSNSAGNAYTMGCNGGDYQRWTVYGFGSVVLVDRATGRCLDSDANGSAYTLDCNNGPYQQWRMVESGYGAVNLVNVATGRCLDSNSAGNAYTMGCNGGSYQRWVRG